MSLHSPKTVHQSLIKTVYYNVNMEYVLRSHAISFEKQQHIFNVLSHMAIERFFSVLEVCYIQHIWTLNLTGLNSFIVYAEWT